MTATAVPTSPACPRCGRALPGDAPAGLCPRCLLSDGFAQSEADYRVRTGDGRRFVPPTIEELAGEFPNLEFVRPLGSGGMGAVYLAKQIRLDRPIAVKVLPPDLADDPAFAERFLREARALARLSHPSIVGVFDFGQTPGGLYFFLMEYIEGPTLRQVVASKSADPKQALEIVRQVCDALQYAHDRGVVHRDIKPENVLLDSHGRVKIADFGLAKLLGLADAPAGSPAAGSLTGTRQAMGTPHYMAPEQIVGSRGVDHRADIYSLGVVFYELLTGELPLGRFAAPSKKVRIDVRIDEVVMRTLDSEPEHRYQRAGDVRTDIDSISHVAAAASPRPAAAMRFVREATAGVGNAARTVLQSPGPGDMSRKAVGGLAWAAAAPLALLCMLLYEGFERSIDPLAALFAILGFVLAIPAITAPIGATALGVLAIREVRRSAGRVTGLVPGLAAALLFPLVLIDIAVGCLLVGLLTALGGEVERSVLFGLPLAVALSIYLDGRLVWSAWRRATAGLPPELIEPELAAVPRTVRRAFAAAAAWCDRGWAAFRDPFGGAPDPSAPAVADSARPPVVSAERSGLSAKAVGGVALVAAFAMAILLFVAVESTHPSDPARGVLILLLGTIGFPAVVAPFGAPLLGWLAAQEITKANGRLHGLGLAFAAMLVFPLLLIDLAICGVVGLVALLCVLFFDLRSAPGHVVAVNFAVGITAAVLACAVVDTLIVRAIRRRLSGGPEPAGLPESTPAETAPRRSYRDLWVAAAVVGVAAALFVVKAAREGTSPFPPPPPPDVPMPVTPGVGHATQAAASERNPSETEEPGRRWRLGSNGPELTAWWFDFNPELRITDSQKAEVDRVLRDVYAEYARLLEAHTKVRLEGNGLRFDVAPFPAELDGLEHRFWSGVDPLLNRGQQEMMRSNFVLRAQRWGPVGSPDELYDSVFLPIGDESFHLTLGRSGLWYRYDVGFASISWSGGAPELPLWLRIWQRKFEDRMAAADLARVGGLGIDPNRPPLLAARPRP